VDATAAAKGDVDAFEGRRDGLAAAAETLESEVADRV